MSTPEDTAKRKQQEGWNNRHPWHWREEVCFALVAGEVAGEVAVVCVWMCDVMDSHQSTEENSVCIIILTLRRDKLWL